MTTPTREQVVQLSRKHWHRDEWNYEYFDAYAFYQEARADLEATVAEQAAEIDRLKSTPPDQRQDLHCVVSDISAECRELRQQLAAEQSYAEQLRNALADTEALELGTCERLAKTRAMLTSEQSKVKVLTDAATIAADQIRVCDYTPARSTLLVTLAAVKEK